MNDLQKKFYIVSRTSFITWVLLVLANSNFIYFLIEDFNIGALIRVSIVPEYSSYLHLILFMTWLSSYLAYNLYKD